MSDHDLNFAMPDVGEGLHEAEVIEWLVGIGQPVVEDQPVVVVQTDKAVVDIPAPSNGIITGHGAEVGETVLVGSTLFTIGEIAPSLSPAPSPTPPPEALASAGVVSQHTPMPRPKASPATRKRALDLGVLLAGVRGTGPGGRISTADVEAAAPSVDNPDASAARPAGAGVAAVRAARARVRPAVVPTGTDRIEPLRGTRRQIARAMTESWTTVPHVTELREIDAVELVRAHRALRSHLAPHGVRMTMLPLFIRATVAALREHPSFNASLDFAAETITYRAHCNIGIAMSAADGLVVPVIHDADTKSLLQLAQEIEALSTAARNRTLTVDQLSDGTFTISNYGSYGTWMGTPIIRPPEAAIVGFGRVHDAVVAVDGQAVVRSVLPLAVSADHRLNDGHHLGGFVSTLSAYLSDPVLLLGTSGPDAGA